MQTRPFSLERYFARYEFTTQYMLGSSDCEALSIADILNLEPDAEEKFKSHWLGYTESPGAPSLRQEISRIYRGIDPSEILVHTGAEEAIYLFMQAVLHAGDHVIVHWPCYQSLEEIPLAIGCEVTRWEGNEQNGWALNIEELPRLIRPNTRVVIVNTPHNPTGYLMEADDFQRLNAICQERGIVLFLDEVYRESEFDPADRLPSACEINPLAVSLGVMSKTYGLAGLRIGWVATHNQPVLARMASLKDYTTICNSAPSEYLAELALRHRQQIAGRNLEIIRSNLVRLDDFFQRHSDTFAWVRPKAGSIAFPKLLKGPVEDFCAQLVISKGVLLIPGTLFEDQENHFRLGYGRKNMPEALDLLKDFISA